MNIIIKRRDAKTQRHRERGRSLLAPLRLCAFAFLFVFYSLITLSATEAEQDFPVLYKGRFRPASAYARLWLKEQAQDIPPLPVSLMWNLHFQRQNVQAEEAFKQYFETLKASFPSPKEIEINLEKNYPLFQRLQTAGSLMPLLPSKRPGIWLSPHAFHVHTYQRHANQLVPIGNFTSFSDDDFQNVRQAYLDWEYARSTNLPKQQQLYQHFISSLKKAFTPLAGTPYQEATDKTLYYPSLRQLQAEDLYDQYPWMRGLLILYGMSICLLLLSLYLPKYKTFALSVLLTAFICHTMLLAWRMYILQRPPVSNMFETVIYVPWVAVLSGLCFHQQATLIASSLASFTLLFILEVKGFHEQLEPVQAVLDSQLWLTIHVLLIVGSYGVFLLSSLLGHFYLSSYLYHQKETPFMRTQAGLILQTLYIGTTLLITGTLLGGVWAAESWGRFWDWDPKESWAFISSCLYLLCIHAYRFQRIAGFGLAVGAAGGFLAISFTWYGVNYILGTGLHSYGFGSGGEFYYYAFLLAELLFLSYAINQLKKTVFKFK